MKVPENLKEQIKGQLTSVMDQLVDVMYNTCTSIFVGMPDGLNDEQVNLIINNVSKSVSDGLLTSFKSYGNEMSSRIKSMKPEDFNVGSV